MRLNKIKLFAAGLILAAAVAVTGADASAATRTDETVVVPVGDEITVSGVPNLKINGKATKKLKKKVKVIQYSKGSVYSTYRTKSYFKSEAAYKDENAYNAEHGDQVYKYYPATSSYRLIFKKAGTYKISYTDYADVSEYDYGWDDNDNRVISKYNVATGEYENPVKAVYVSPIYESWDYNTYTYVDVTTYTDSNGKTYNRAAESYFETENGKRYAENSEGYFVPVSLVKGADGVLHVKYSSQKKLSYTHVEVYKVVASTNILKSVKLGKSTNKSYTVGKEGGSTQSIKRGKFLTGKSGKVTVSMGPDYALTSILARTYDADGNVEYKLVKNKGTVTYGQNRSGSKSEEGASVTYETKSQFKSTAIYVFYKDKTTGESTTVKSEGKDADGNQTFVIEEKYQRTNPKTNKKQLLTRTYNVTRKKPYAEAKNYYYYYTETYQYFESDGSIKSYTDSETSSSSLPINNYTTSTFYLK